MNRELGSDIYRFVTNHVESSRKNEVVEEEVEGEGEPHIILQMAYKQQVYASEDSRDNSEMNDNEGKEGKNQMEINYDLFEEKGRKEVNEVDEETVKKVKRKRKGGRNLLNHHVRNILKTIGIRKIKKKQVNLLQNPKFYTKLPKNFEEKKVDEKKKYLSKLLQKLEEEESRTIKRVKELKENMENLGKSKPVQKFSQPTVIETFRKYMICRTLLSRHQLEMEELCLSIISRRIRYTKSAIETTEVEDEDRKKPTMLPSYVCRDFFKDIIYTALIDPKGRVIWNKIEILEATEKELFAKFERVEKSFKTLIPKKKNKKMGETFLRNEIFPKYEFPYSSHDNFEIVWQDDVEENFNSMFFSDPKSQCGSSVHTFLGEIDKIGMDKIKPKQYLGYIQSLVKHMNDLYHVSLETNRNKVSALVYRNIFRLIGRELLTIEGSKCENLDRGYNENSIYLRNFSPIQMGISRQFLKSEGTNVSFQKSIEMLKNIPFCIDPNSMLHAIKLTCEYVGVEAREQCILKNEKWSFAGDDFFPILTYVVVQCSVNDIHSYLKYVQKYANLYTLDREDGGSEVRYFLASLDGAAEYVSSLTKEKLSGLLKETNENENKPLIKLKDKLDRKYAVVVDGVNTISSAVVKDEVDFENMESCLMDCIDICEGMLEDCSTLKK